MEEQRKSENALVPALRFEGFSDPWEQRRLGEISESYSGGTPSVGNESYYGGDIPFIRSAEISSDSTELRLTEKGLDNSSAALVESGCVLYALYGATSGEVAISRIRGAINQAILAIVPSKNNNAEFIAAWLRREKPKILDTYLQGGQGNLSGAIVKDLTLALPSGEEQSRIGALFQKLDSLIALHQRKHEKLKTVKQSLLEKMFPKEGEDVPEIRFEGFTDPWEQRRLGEVVDVRSGRDYKHLKPGLIPVYGTGGLMTYVNEALSKNEDAIGIGRKGTIDQPYKLYAPFWTVDTLFYAIPKIGIDIEFALSCFLRINWKAKDESTGLPSLSKSAINDTRILLPDAREQSRIGTLFSKLDSLIALHQRELDILKNLKQALLEKMFV